MRIYYVVLHCDKHAIEICRLHDCILESCKKATGIAIPQSKPFCGKHKTIIPGWTDEHTIARDRSLFWHSMWIDNDKPETGWVSDIMKSTRSQYHYLVRRLKRSRDLQIPVVLYNTLIVTHFTYCLLVWGSIINECHRFHLVQNRALGNIVNEDYIAHSEPICKTLRLLKVTDMFA